MGHLDIKHPDVFRKFEKGFYVIRRSSHSWTGLNSDLVTEQTLVKSVKGTGGLTHVGGMSEQTMHRLATVHVRDNQPINQRRHDTAYLNKRLFY